MKRSIGRRDVLAGLVDQLRSMGVENPSTRRGKAVGTFHLDGTNLVGRGRIDVSPMERAELVEIHQTVYKDLNRRWVHFSYGGYNRDTLTLARALGIALFEFDENSTLTPLTPAAQRMWRRTPSGRKRRNLVLASWAAATALTLGVLALLFPEPAARVGTFGLWTIVIVAVLAVMGLIGVIIAPPERKNWWQ